MTDTADVIVLGMGVGGELLAEHVADAGLDVVGIEANLVGGECPYWGCIPTKMMTRAATTLAEARRVPQLAGTATVDPDWAPIAPRIRVEATDTWDDRVAVERFEEKGGRFVRGTGRLDGPGRVQVGDRTFEARRAVVLATGTRPAIPPVPGLDTVEYWTNHEAVETKEVPASLVVLGGGAVGLELAQVFAPLRFEGDDRRAIRGAAPARGARGGRTDRRGVRARRHRRAHRGGRARCRALAEGVEVTLDRGEPLRSERLLVATGRRTDLHPLGVASVGLDADAHAVPVDDRLRARDRLWAIGDVTGLGPFTHIAVYQARIAAADILGEDAASGRLPRRCRGSRSRTRRSARSASPSGKHASRASTCASGWRTCGRPSRGWIHKIGNEGFFKLVEDRRRGVLVGATSVGPHGGETLGLIALAVYAEVPVDTAAVDDLRVPDVPPRDRGRARRPAVAG